MLGTKVKCPGMVKDRTGLMTPCGYEGYIILEEGVFAPDSGYDPLACRVKCRSCGHIYIVFPAVNGGKRNDENR